MSLHTDPTTQTRPDPADPPACGCHDTLDCPGPDTVAIGADQLACLADLLADLDEFLRRGNGATELLACFYATRGHRHQRLDAATLVDLVGFTADSLHTRCQQADTAEGGQQ